MNTITHEVHGDWTYVPDAYTSTPLPIHEKTEIVLMYPNCGHWIVVTLEPDLWFEQLPPDQKWTLSSNGESHRCYFAYTANRYVGDVIQSLDQRIGRWDFIPGDGLYLEADTKDLDEVQAVMADALCALYRPSADNPAAYGHTVH